LNDETIQKALAAINETAYTNSLKKLIKEKYKSLKHEQYLVRKKKTTDYLIQRGFEAVLVKSFVENLTKQIV